MARTTITVPDDLLAEASSLKVNVAEAARRGVAEAVAAARVAGQLDRIADQARAHPLPVAPDAVARALRELREHGESV